MPDTPDLNPSLKQRGMTLIPALDKGRDVWLLLRSYELALFEEQMGTPILTLIQSGGLLSVRAVLNALLVGRAWEWREAAKHKRKMPKLDAQRVAGWIDDYPGGFTELAPLVLEAVLTAIPGGREALESEGDDDEDDDDEAAALPPFSETSETTKPPGSIGDGASKMPPDAE